MTKGMPKLKKALPLQQNQKKYIQTYKSFKQWQI